MKRIKLFITGMGGMAGRVLAKYAIRENYLVGGTIHRNLPEELKILAAQGLLRYYFVDLKDGSETEDAIQDFKPDVVAHLAGKALGRSDSRIFDPQIYYENITIFKNVLSAAKNLNDLPRFILTSGCLVYDNLTSPDLITEIPAANLPDVDPQKEPYLASRLEQEKLLVKEKGLDYIITRPTQFTGSGKIPEVVEWYIAKEISKIMAGKTKTVKSRNKLGEVDMLDVRDIARAYLILMRKGTRGEVYHISSGLPVTVEYLSRVFLEVAGLNPNQYQVESTDNEKKTFFRFSPDKLMKLGWKPQFSLKDALMSYWRYFKNEY